MSKAIDEMTVKELKEELRKLDLKVGGNKSVLKDRLAAAREEGSSTQRKTSPKKKKSPTGTPEEKATGFDVGIQEEGEDGQTYEVVVTKAGKRWRKCSATTATCTLAATESSRELELKKLTIPKLKERLERLGVNLTELRAKVRAGRKGPARKGSPPNKKEYIAAILEKEGSRKKTPPKRSPKKTPPSSKRKIAPKRKPDKGKERVKDKPITKPKRKADSKSAMSIELRGWTVVGELQEAFHFLKTFDQSQLMDRLKDAQETTKEQQFAGIVRLEADAGCERNCGAQALVVQMSHEEYPIEPLYNKRKFLIGVNVGGKPKGPIRADVSILQYLIVADLDALYRFIQDVDTMDQLLTRERPNSIQIFANPPIKAPKLMNVRLPKDKATNMFTGLYMSPPQKK